MAEEGRKQDMGSGSIPRLMLNLAVPAVVAQLINMLYNIVDRIYIGHIPEAGASALTGVGLFLPILMMINAFAMLAGAGGAPRAAIAMGKNDREGAQKILGNCFSVLMLFAAVLTVLFYIFAPRLLRLFGASDVTLPYALSYARIYILGIVFVMIVMGLNPFITTQGFAKFSMITTVVGAVCNIILDPIFIYGFHMGVRGAALATITSQAVSTVWVLSFLLGKKTVIKLKKQCMKLEKDVVLPCIALGIASFIMQASESVIVVCFNSSLLKYGGDVAVGAMTILSSVMQFSMLPMQGLGQGAQPITSYNYGAKNAERVKKTFYLLLAATLGYAMFIWGLVMIFPQVFARIFSPDAELIAYTGWALRIYCAGMGIFGAQVACQMTFTSLGNAKASIMVAVMRKFVLLLPLIYIMPHLMENQTMGVYLAEPVADFIAVTFTVILFYFQFRKAMKQIETDRKEAGTGGNFK